MRFLLHLAIRSEIHFDFKYTNSFKVELLKKCFTTFCIFLLERSQE